VPTHYEVLGIGSGASEEEVRQAYRRLVKAAHPDVAGDAGQFRRITEAYDVLSDPVRRAAYDRSLGTAAVVIPPTRPRHYGRYVVLALVALVVGGVARLALVTARQSIGDHCPVGTWRGDEFEVPFRGSLDGIQVAAPIRGGAGVTLTVDADGTVRTNYSGSDPLTGADGGYRIEGAYSGSTLERWHATDGQVRQSGTDASGLRFDATINGRRPDQPLAVTVLDGEYPYTCTATTLDVGPYRFARAGGSRALGSPRLATSDPRGSLRA
jgi:hypothetical protein